MNASTSLCPVSEEVTSFANTMEVETTSELNEDTQGYYWLILSLLLIPVLFIVARLQARLLGNENNCQQRADASSPESTKSSAENETKIFAYKGKFRMEIREGIITDEDTDALVRFIYPHEDDANGILDAAGDRVRRELLDDQPQNNFRCTSAGNINQTKLLFHMNVWFDEICLSRFRTRLSKVLRSADKQNLRSIAFPRLISCSVDFVKAFYDAIFEFWEVENPRCLWLIRIVFLTGKAPQRGMKEWCVMAESMESIGAYFSMNSMAHQDAPKPPDDIHTDVLGPRSVRVNWTPSDGATRYIVEYKRTSHGDATASRATTDTNSATIGGLQPNSDYAFRVCAFNNDDDIGPGELSHVVEARTFAAHIGTAPNLTKDAEKEKRSRRTEIPVPLKDLSTIVDAVEEQVQKKGSIEQQRSSIKTEIEKLLRIADSLDRRAAFHTRNAKIADGRIATVGLANIFSTIVDSSFAPLTAGASIGLAIPGIVSGVAGKTTSLIDMICSEIPRKDGIKATPLTAGASLGLAIPGIASGVAGKTTSLIDMIGSEIPRKDGIKATLDNIREEIEEVSKLIEQYQEKCEEGKQFLETDEGKSFFEEECSQLSGERENSSRLFHYLLQLFRFTGTASVVRSTGTVAMGRISMTESDSKDILRASIDLDERAARIRDIVSDRISIRNCSETTRKVRDEVKEINDDIDAIYDLFEEVYVEIIKANERFKDMFTCKNVISD